MTDDGKALIAEARNWSDWTKEGKLLHALADALEAATVAPAADRVKASMVLWEVLWPGTVDVMDHPELGAERFKVRQILDALTSSNVLRDVRDVQAEALEQAADAMEAAPGPLEEYREATLEEARYLRARAQAIREAHSER